MEFGQFRARDARELTLGCVARVVQGAGRRCADLGKLIEGCRHAESLGQRFRIQPGGGRRSSPTSFTSASGASDDVLLRSLGVPASSSWADPPESVLPVILVGCRIPGEWSPDRRSRFAKALSGLVEQVRYRSRPASTSVFTQCRWWQSLAVDDHPVASRGLAAVNADSGAAG
jgi:hypothetical protein